MSDSTDSSEQASSEEQSANHNYLDSKEDRAGGKTLKKSKILSLKKEKNSCQSKTIPTAINRVVKWTSSYAEEQINSNPNVFFLFGDNENAKYRIEIDNPGGEDQASVTRPTAVGKLPYDRLPENGGKIGNAIGITTTFDNRYTPDINEFKVLMDKEFQPIEKWVINGGSVIISCDNNGKHKLDSEIAELGSKIPGAKEHIQSKVDELIELGKKKAEISLPELERLKEDVHRDLNKERQSYHSAGGLRKYLSVVQSSVQQHPQRKRIRSDMEKSEQKEADSKRRNMKTQDINRKEVGEASLESSEEVSNETYEASGLKSSLHGIIYQLKLLMLFIKRGLDQKYSFRLATEMDAAEKFDDLVLKYVNERKDGVVYRFLQAKHKQDEYKKITLNDLLSDKEDEFSLQKYFISYRKIIQNSEFKDENNEIKDFVICTNIDMDKNLRKSFERLESEDNILDTQRNSKRLQFKIDNFPNKDKLISILKEASDVYRLPKRLVEHLSSKKTLSLRDKLFKTYHSILVKKIIKIEKVEGGVKTCHAKFRESVLDKDLEDEELKKFRKNLLKVYSKQSKSQMNRNKEELLKDLSRKDFQVSNNFAKAFQSEINIEFTDNELMDLVDTIAEAIIKAEGDIVNIERRGKAKYLIGDNINKLAGYVFVKKDQEKDIYYFSSLFFNDSKLPESLNSFRDKLKEKLQSEGMEFSRDKYKFRIEKFTAFKEPALPNDDVTDEEIHSFFEKLVFAVNQPNEVELGKIIEEELGEEFNPVESETVYSKFLTKVLDWMKEKQGRFFSHQEGKKFFEEVKRNLAKLELIALALEYRDKIEKLGVTFSEKLIELKRFLTSKKQVFNLVSTHGTTLNSIKVFQILQDITEYKNEDSYIFTRLGYFSGPLIKNHIVQAFKSERNTLLVIECKTMEEDSEDIYNQLAKVVRSNRNKKLILITEKDNSLALRFKQDFFMDNGYEERINENNSLKDLTDESQKKLLNEGKVIFLGEEISLGALIDEGSKHLIGPEVLSKLINNEKVAIGIHRPYLSDLNCIYYDIRAEIKQEQLLNAVENNQNDVFVISGTTETEFTQLISSEEENQTDPTKEDRFFFLTNTDDETNLEDFKRICRDIPDKIVHFIESKENKFSWNRYYDPYYISRQFYQIEIDVNHINDCIMETDEKKKDIFVLSGINNEDKLSEIIRKNATDDSGCDLDKKCVILLRSRDEEESFSNLCKQLKGRNIHWLQKAEKEARGDKQPKIRLVWRRSLNKVENLLKGRKKTTELTNDESKLIQIINNERCVVIADKPGMGKSTTLAYLSEKYRKKYEGEWIIRIDLKDCKPQIDNLPSDSEFYEDDVIDCLSLLSNTKGTLEKGLLRYRLFEQGKLVLLFDGFDEIHSSQQKKIVSLVKLLKESTKTKLVITTRPYEKEQNDLESALSVLAFNFQPITIDKRQEFIEHFWKSGLKLKYIQADLESFRYSLFARELLNKFDKFLGENESDFMGIPLQTRILAESFSITFEENRHESDKNKIEVLLYDLNIVKLFERFIERKYEIYFNEKTKFGSSISKYDKSSLKLYYTKSHQRLAFKYLFEDSSQVFELFFSGGFFFERKLPDDDKKNEINRIGIAQSKTDKIEFIHRTFAEYFISELIFERFREKLSNPNYSTESKEKMWTFLLDNIFLEPNNNIIRYFINYKLPYRPLELRNIESDKSDIADLQLRNAIKKCISKNEIVTQLYIAVTENLFEILKLLVEKGADVNAKTDKRYHRTSLHISAKNGNFTIVNYLLSKGARVDAADRHGSTPLHDSVQHNNFEMLECLANSSKNIDIADDNGRTPLLLSVVKKRLEIVKYLVGKGADVNACEKDGKSSLHLAAQGSLKIVNYLLETGKINNLNAADKYGNTPLLLAAENQKWETVITLVGQEADLNAFNNENKTTFLFAAEFGNLNVLKRLVENKADYTVMDKYGNNALHLATSYGSRNVVEYLVRDKRIEVNFANKNGKTPLHSAVEIRKLEIVKYLTENGANVNLADKAAKTPLHFAAKNGCLEIVKHLVAEEAKLDDADECLKTPLLIAVENKKWDVAKYLIKKNANVHKADKINRVPLHYAAEAGNLKIVELLFQKGDNLSVVDKMTALRLAAAKEHWDVAQYLVNKKINFRTESME